MRVWAEHIPQEMKRSKLGRTLPTSRKLLLGLCSSAHRCSFSRYARCLFSERKDLDGPLRPHTQMLVDWTDLARRDFIFRAWETFWLRTVICCGATRALVRLIWFASVNCQAVVRMNSLKNQVADRNWNAYHLTRIPRTSQCRGVQRRGFLSTARRGRGQNNPLFCSKIFYFPDFTRLNTL